MSNVLNFAKQFVKTPYKLGSLDPKEGLDCATFVLHFFKELDGKDLKIDYPPDVFARYAADSASKIYEYYIQQCLILKRYPCQVDLLDILVFNEKERHSQHVGIVIADNLFIHCDPNGVEIHKISLCKKSLLYVGKFKEGVR